MQRTLAVFSFLVLCAANLAAQVTSGEILGVVQDASGAIVSEAKVTVRSLDTNAVREVISFPDGRFRVPALPPGSYELLVEKSGFSRFVQGPITLRLNQSADVTVKLQVSGVAETVTVTSDVALVNTTNAEIGVNFDARRIQEVPLAPSRNILNLALNVAGVSQLSTGQQGFSASGNNGTDGGVSFSVNGMRTRSNNFMVDGQDTNDPSVTGLSQGINNPDIVAEFRLITNQFLPEFGRAAGSVVNIITRGGTNAFHGSAFWFHNSNPLNTRTNQEKAIFSESPWRINNQFGGVFGGPVVIPKAYNGKDKTFFFASLQRWTDRRLGSGSTLRGAPTEAGRAALQPVASRQTVKALLDFLPAAQQPVTGLSASYTAGGQNYVVPLGALTGSTTNRFDDWQWSARIDHRFNEKHQLNARYLYDDGFNGGGGQATPPGNTTVVPTRRQSMTSAWTQTFTPRVFGELRASYSRFASTTTAADPRSELVPSIEVPELGLTGFNADVTRTAIGLAVNLPQFRRNNLYQLQYTLGWLRGGHSMKYGIDFRRQDIVSFFVPTIRGRLVYNTLQDLVDDVAQTATINGALPGGQTNQYYKYYDYFFFLQDEWRVTSRFTLSFGVRYEAPGNPIENLKTLNEPIVRAANNDPRYLVKPVPPRDNNNWAPRLGFNYRFGKGPGGLGWLTGDQALVLRGGYSRTYDFAFINIALNIGSSFPFLNSATLNPRTPNSWVSIQRAVSNPVIPDPNALTRTIVGEDFRAPYAEQVSMQLQRAFVKDWALSVGWVGTKGSALYQTIDGNPTVPGSCGTPCVAGNVRRGDVTQGVRRLRANAASSIYHSLQASLDKRLSRDFTMGAHYTWSAYIDDASEIFNPAVSGDVAVSQDSFNRRIDRGRSTYDRPQRFSATFVYELPFLRAQKGFAGRILGGWQINGFLAFQSGAPFTPLAGIDPGFRLSGIDALVGNAIRPNVATNLPLSTTNIAAIYSYNTATAVNNSRNSLFTNVTAATPLGGAGRNILRADGIQNFDFGAFKNIKIWEQHRLQFRAEFFNLTNTRNFGIPESRISSANFANQWGTNGGNRRITLGLRYVF
ncbi:MAG: TonB-dependent receptor [Acidobacteria bacterium]|nr:TonB-dependent receptor [Acidobacteriota bacterium]